MAINRVEIKDFLVFKGEFATDFCPGVNVIIGGNATGKTTILKTAYAIYDVIKKRQTSGPNAILIPMQEYFPYGDLSRSYLHFENKKEISLRYSQKSIVRFKIYEYGVVDNIIYIPCNDMLSHAKGFLALDREYELPFDKLRSDIISKAELPITRKVADNASKILDTIKKVIGGEVVHDNGIFYIAKESGEKIPFSLEASAFQKFGLLWKLVRNGLLESGTILFWDEPENSLNPELIPVLVDILLELSRNGVQIFIATHDYNLARYFDIRNDKNVSVMFYNLSKQDDGRINCDSSERYLNLPNNILEKTGDELFKAVVTDAVRVLDDE